MSQKYKKHQRTETPFHAPEHLLPVKPIVLANTNISISTIIATILASDIRSHAIPFQTRNNFDLYDFECYLQNTECDIESILTQDGGHNKRNNMEIILICIYKSQFLIKFAINNGMCNGKMYLIT